MSSFTPPWKKRRTILFYFSIGAATLVLLVFAGVGYWNSKAPNKLITDKLLQMFEGKLNFTETRLTTDGIELFNVSFPQIDSAKIDSLKLSFAWQQLKPTITKIAVRSKSLVVTQELIQYMRAKAQSIWKTKQAAGENNKFKLIPENIELDINSVQYRKHNIPLTAEIRRRDSRWEIIAQSKNAALFFDEGWFSSETVKLIEAQGELRFVYAPETRSLVLRKAQLDIEPNKRNYFAVHVIGQMDLNSLNDPKRAELNLHVPRFACGRIADIAGGSLTKDLAENFEVGGEAELAAVIRFDEASAQKTSVEITNLVNRCKLKILEESKLVASAAQLEKGPIHSEAQKQSKNEILYSWQEFIPIQEIPVTVKRIFLANEDYSFEAHDGVDFKSLLQAIAKSAFENEKLIGASTITMQLARNIFLGHERSLARKAQELLISKFLDQTLSKSRQLEIYFNVAEFGPGIYGIHHAGKHFFDKHVRDLTPLEITYLAAILPAPTKRYLYFCRGELTPAMRQLVYQKISRQVQLGVMTEAQAQVAYSQKLEFADSASRRGKQNALAPQCVNSTYM